MQRGRGKALGRAEVVSASSASSVSTPWPRALALLPPQSDVQARGKAMASLEPWRQALELLQAIRGCSLRCGQVGESSSQLLTSALCVLGSLWRLAVGLISGVRLSLVTQNALLGACSSGSAWRRATNTLANMGAETLQPDALSPVMALGFCDWRKALAPERGPWELAEATLRCRPQSNLLLAAWAQGAEWSRGLSFLGRSDDVGDHTVLSAAERAEAWSCCLALLTQLSASCRPGAVALNVALGAARTWQRALLGFADAAPDRIRFNALLRSLSAAWRQALRTLRCFEVGWPLECVFAPRLHSYRAPFSPTARWWLDVKWPCSALRRCRALFQRLRWRWALSLEGRLAMKQLQPSLVTEEKLLRAQEVGSGPLERPVLGG